jgi:hypothetical protein
MFFSPNSLFIFPLHFVHHLGIKRSRTIEGEEEIISDREEEEIISDREEEETQEESSKRRYAHNKNPTNIFFIINYIHIW